MASTSTSTSATKPLQNIYYERKVATEKPCYICKRPTVVVLATIDTKDFLYTCESHLSDSGFATLIPAPSPVPAPSGPSQDEIRKIVAEYKAKEEKRSKSDDKDKDKDKNKEKDKEDKDEEKEKSKPTVPAPAPTPAAVAAVHRKFALHRQIFDMRRDDIKRKEQGVKAREVGKGLPQVPRGMF